MQRRPAAVAVAVFRGPLPEALIKRNYLYSDGPRALPTNITKTAPPEAKEWEAVGFILSQAMLFLLLGATSRKRSLKLPQTTQSDLSWAIFFWKNPLPHPYPSPRHWSKNSTKSVWPWRQASGFFQGNKPEIFSKLKLKYFINVFFGYFWIIIIFDVIFGLSLETVGGQNMGIFFVNLGVMKPQLSVWVGNPWREASPILKWKVHQANNEKYWVFAPQLFPNQTWGFFFVTQNHPKKKTRKKNV